MNNFHKFYLVVGLMAIGGIIGLLKSAGCFDTEIHIIKYQYCYIYEKNNLTDSILDVYASDDLKTAYDIINYYKIWLDSNLKDTNMVFPEPSNWSDIKKLSKAGIISYTDDSLLAKINVKGTMPERPFHFNFTTYVPTFSLHDKLPDEPKTGNDHNTRKVN